MGKFLIPDKEFTHLAPTMSNIGRAHSTAAGPRRFQFFTRQECGGLAFLPIPRRMAELGRSLHQTPIIYICLLSCFKTTLLLAAGLTL